MKLKLIVTTIFSLILILAMVLPADANGVGGLTPDTVTATLDQGQSLTTEKTVVLPSFAPKVDVIFAFDLTGSMSSTIASAMANSITIMNNLDATGVDLQYGVTSFMDYPHYYDSYGYAADYGYSSYGDYAYRLDQAITGTRTDVQLAINGLVLGYGADGPQDYTRIMYESYADTNVGWRDGAKKILVIFGDNIPHDNDINAGLFGWTYSTGGDPGRDEVMFTGDDLDLQTVVSDMNTNGVHLMACWNGTGVQDYWDFWTAQTDGDFFDMNSGDFVTNVVAAITAGATVTEVDGLHLAVTTPGYESWLTSVTPPSYDDVLPGDSRVFQETITVPDDADAILHTFTVSALDGNGVSYGEEVNYITVNAEVTGGGARVWQLDSEIFGASAPTSLDGPQSQAITAVSIYEMEKNNGLGDDGQTGSVNIPAGETRTWVSDLVALADVTYVADGSWKVELSTDSPWIDDDASGCDVLIGQWDGSVFTPFSSVFNMFSVTWDTEVGKYIFELQGQSGDETVFKDNYLAIQITNKDDVYHTVYTGEGDYASCLTSPENDPGYPLPEMATGLLMGLGLAGLAAFIVIRRRKAGATQ